MEGGKRKEKEGWQVRKRKEIEERRQRREVG